MNYNARMSDLTLTDKHKVWLSYKQLTITMDWKLSVINFIFILEAVDLGWHS